jgi:hypothetical protein
MKQKLSSNDYARVSQAAGVLARQACVESARHLRDVRLQIQFNREVAYYARGIVRDVAQGKKSVKWGLDEIKKDTKALATKSLEIGRKSVGLVAGGFQIAGGTAVCGYTIGFGCIAGITMAAHGFNNILENTENLWKGTSDAKGPVRQIYQKLADVRGGTEYDANKAYAIVDLATSGYALFRKVLIPNSWKLFRTIPTDYVRAYKQSSKAALGLEMLSDAITIEQLLKIHALSIKDSSPTRTN